MSEWPLRDTVPMGTPPPWLRPGPPPARPRWAMRVDPARPGRPTPAAARCARFLADKAEILTRLGHADRIRPEILAMLPALALSSPRHSAVELVREATALLREPAPAWEPDGGWNHGWADGLAWYDPEHGDDGTLPPAARHRAAPPAAPAAPDWQAAYLRELGPK